MSKLYLGVFLLAFWLFFPPIMSYMGFYSSPSLDNISNMMKADTGAMFNPLTGVSYLANLMLYYAELIFSIWIPEMGLFGNLIKIMAQLMSLLVIYLLVRGD